MVSNLINITTNSFFSKIGFYLIIFFSVISLSQLHNDLLNYPQPTTNLNKLTKFSEREPKFTKIIYGYFAQTQEREGEKLFSI